MYCVIQTVTNKTPNQYGAYKELVADSFTFGWDGDTKTKYVYKYGDERFERPVREAYKISIHESYREDGKVKKKQWSICTMSYYDIVDFSLYDCADGRINEKAEKIGISPDEIYNLIEEKLEPLRVRIEKEFQQSEEYRTKKKHDAIIAAYIESKTKFESVYGSDTYDYCYDVFGNLQNEEYYNQLIKNKKEQEEYQRRSYYNQQHSNYSNYSDDFSSYFSNSKSTYNEQEKVMLKKIYRVASKKFHPDITNDDGKMMKFLTKLKEEWGI
ncbi:hypothetical protein ABEP17_10810 [Priestia flexa]|uniref:hypothetical protein n=1 Tax=Priestia flexa TaxID=86664 RepID=UPI003D2A5B6D